MLVKNKTNWCVYSRASEEGILQLYFSFFDVEFGAPNMVLGGRPTTIK